MEKLKHLQTNIQSGQAKPHLAYSSVVDEFMVHYPNNPLAGLFGKIFVPRRKLKPVIRKRETIPLEGVKEAKLRIHISSGINVPIREGSLQAIIEMNEKINTEYGNRRPTGMGAPPMGGYPGGPGDYPPGAGGYPPGTGGYGGQTGAFSGGFSQGPPGSRGFGASGYPQDDRYGRTGQSNFRSETGFGGQDYG